MKSSRLFGVLVKFPEPGNVKTRLAKVIGDENAALEYKFIAEKVIENTLPLDFDFERVIFYTPAGMRDQFENWMPGNILMQQKGCDIGEIMINCLHDLLALGAEKAVIAGSDIPKLDRNIVMHAFRTLDGADIVLGPASDGGYYLIGMKSLHTDIFKGILWGSSTVFNETISAIRKLGLSYGTLPTLSDVDTVEDLTNVKGERTRS